MKFVLATLAYLAMAALIGIGLIKASHPPHSFTVLAIGVIIFLGLFIKTGCLSSHD